MITSMDLSENMSIDYLFSLPIFSGISLNQLCEFCSPDFEIYAENKIIFSIEIKNRTKYKMDSFSSFLIEEKKVNDLKERHYNGHKCLYINFFEDGILIFDISKRFELDLICDFKHPSNHYYQKNNSTNKTRSKRVFYLQHIPQIYGDSIIKKPAIEIINEYYYYYYQQNLKDFF